MELKEIEKKVWEGLSRPESPDQPLIHVQEARESDCFEAVFYLKLAGVARVRNERRDRKDSEPDTKEQYTNSLIPIMSASQRLDFIYTGGRDEQGRSFFDWKITGHSIGRAKEEAFHLAQQLYQNLTFIFETAKKDYRLIPVTSPEKVDRTKIEGLWRGTIQHRGIAIEARQRTIGFLTQDELLHSRSSVVLIPNTGKGTAGNLDPVVSGALLCPAPIKLILSFTPIMFSEDELRKVAYALEWLQNGEIKQIRYHRAIKGGVEDIEVINELRQNLQIWLKNPSGYKVSCSVISDEPIPSSFLTMVVKEIFHGSPVSIRMEKNLTEDIVPADRITEYPGTDILDLRNCINSASALPPLFPGPSTLIDAGVKPFYSPSLIDLPQSGILLGHIGKGRLGKEVRLARADRSRHCYIIGATGTGKSTLLFNMIAQDIKNQEGVVVIDPHGDLYQQVLETIPAWRKGDVVLIDPCDFDHSVGINFLECSGPYRHVQMNFIANEMIKIFDRLYDLRQTGGPIFEQYMRNAMFLVMDNEYLGATLMDIPMVFEDKEYRDFLISRCKNPIVEGFWSKQAGRIQGGENSLENMGPYITSKLNQFTTNALIRPIIGQAKSTIDFREIMDKGNILLVNLSKGLLGELDTKLLGMLIIGKIFSSAMGRAALKPERRRPLFLYVDEFQNFTTDTIAYLLSEARKFGLYLTLANQNLSQLSTNLGRHNILDAVLGNVGTTLFFRLGAVDAEKMEIYTKPELQPQDLQDIPDFHVAGRLLIRNSPSRPFVFRTLPGLKIEKGMDVNSIINISQLKYTTLTRRVEEEIIKRRFSYKDLK